MLICKPSLVLLTSVPNLISSDGEVPICTIPVNEPVVAVMAPLKNTFSVNNPKPGLVFP